MMADNLVNQMTPIERLEQSRLALVYEFNGGAPESTSTDAERTGSSKRVTLAAEADHPRRKGGVPWVAMGKNVATRWWQRHPANAVTQLARPLLERYARRQPAQLMAAAAATGAAIVIIRPWRFLSLGLLMAAVFKTSDAADMISTLLKRDR